MSEPEKLTPGQIHVLELIRKGADKDGWAPVSKVVSQLFTGSIRDGVMPRRLCEYESLGDAGRARLTVEGRNVLDAMAWL